MAQNKLDWKKAPLKIFIGLLIIFIIIAIMFQFTPEEGPGVMSSQFDSVETEEFVNIFEEECPEIETCATDELQIYVFKLLYDGLKVEEVPHIDEIKEVTKVRLDIANQDKTKDYWNYQPLMELALKINLIDENMKKEILSSLLEMNPEEFCVKIRQDEEMWTPFESENGLSDEKYYLRCRLIWIEAVGDLIQNLNNDVRDINYLSDREDFEEVKSKVCKDTSEEVKSIELNLFSGFGYMYIKNRFRFCSIPLTDYEVGKITKGLEEEDVNPKTEFFQSVYRSFL